MMSRKYIKMENITLFKVVAKQSQKVHKVHWIPWQPKDREQKMNAENILPESMKSCKIIGIKQIDSQAAVAQACDPSYSGGRNH
jgi:hypothetical protein